MRELASFVTTEIALRLEIAERQNVTERLLESEERFRTLANQAPIMIWEADASGATTFLNATWCTFTGLSEQDGLNFGWIEAVHLDDRARVLEQWKQTLTPPFHPFHTELRFQRADGVYREVVAHGAAYMDQQGTFLGYIGTVLDITEQKELDRQREMFLSMTTHELKTPLTAVQGAIQLVQRRLRSLLGDTDGLSSRQQTTLSQVMSTLARGIENLQIETGLIHELQDLSRVQAEKLEFHRAPVDLVELVRQTVQDQQTAYPQRIVTFDVFPADASYIVLADAQRTRQVLSNYLTNAFKYSPPEQQEHIWERFYQTHETPVYTGTPGLGLGLHICQAFIQGQQGEVGVESTKGEGSTFWFTLPRVT